MSTAATASIDGEGFRLRPWSLDDVDALVVLADDAEVSRGLSDRFPFPYTRADAVHFIGATSTAPGLVRAIEVEGRLAGGISMQPGSDTQRLGANIGYWLGKDYWGRGLMSRVVPVWCRHLFAHYGLERLQTTVFSNNPASARVLLKSGFQHEGTMRQAAFKHRQMFDLLMFGLLRSDIEAERRT